MGNAWIGNDPETGKPHLLDPSLPNTAQGALRGGKRSKTHFSASTKKTRESRTGWNGTVGHSPKSSPVRKTKETGFSEVKRDGTHKELVSSLKHWLDGGEGVLAEKREKHHDNFGRGTLMQYLIDKQKEESPPPLAREGARICEPCTKEKTQRRGSNRDMMREDKAIAEGMKRLKGSPVMAKILADTQTQYDAEWDAKEAKRKKAAAAAWAARDWGTDVG